LADREEKLDRREKDLARMRERSKETTAANGIARLAAGADAQSDDVDKAIAKLEGDRERLEARLTALARENKRLKTDLAASATAMPEAAGDSRPSAGLR
ncbi:hypothetical protein EN866_42375, partial [Mesorhizobium sp. M2D.F.Ca.ET.223.01.1.1]